MHADLGCFSLELNRMPEFEREALVICAVWRPKAHKFVHAFPGIERPNMSIGGKLEAIRHADVVGGDTRLGRNLGMAEEEDTTAEEERKGKNAKGLHSGC